MCWGPSAPPPRVLGRRGEGEYLELDDVVALERVLPTGELVKIFGTISQVRARHEGARFRLRCPHRGGAACRVAGSSPGHRHRSSPRSSSRPGPGSPCAGHMARSAIRRCSSIGWSAGSRWASRNGEPLFANFEFINGQRGAHVNISGVSGVATKTSYATFLLHSLFTSGVLGSAVVNTRALIFNVKGRTFSTSIDPIPASTRMPSVSIGRWGCPPSPSGPWVCSRRHAPGLTGRWRM